MLQKKKKNQSVDIEDMYALKIGALWKGARQEHISFWMLCMYMLFEYMRPQVMFPQLNILPWGMLSLLLTIITIFLNKSVKWVENPINKLLIAFMLVLVISSIFSFNIDASLYRKEIMITWFLVYFLIINIINTEKLLIMFIAFYLLLSLKMAQFGTIMWIQRGFSFTARGLNGAPGWFENSGEYAIQMLIYGSLAIAFVVSLSSRWSIYKKVILYSAALMGYMSVMGASSRGSQIALAVIFIWFVMKQKNGFKGLIVLALVSSVLYHFLPEEQKERFSNTGSDNSSLQRLAYIEIGLESIKEHPILGIGYNNWMPYMLNKHPRGVGPYEAIQAPHNIYIQCTTELGFVGFIIFLLLIYHAFKNNVRTRKMALEMDNRLFFNLSYGLDAGLIGFLIAGTFVTVLYYPFFWIQITMIVALNTVTTKNWKSFKSKGDDEKNKPEKVSSPPYDIEDFQFNNKNIRPDIEN